MLEKDEIGALAALAKLQLSPQEQESLSSDLSSILDLVEAISTVPTQDVNPLSNPHDAKAPLRADEVTESDQRERFQSIAPAVQNSLYLVPKVIE